MKAIGSIFGGAPKVVPPEPKGPDPELVAAQKRQQEALDKKQADEDNRLKANRSLIASRQGRGGGITLNPATGERGISSTLGG